MGKCSKTTSVLSTCSPYVPESGVDPYVRARLRIDAFALCEVRTGTVVTYFQSHVSMNRVAVRTLSISVLLFDAGYLRLTTAAKTFSETLTEFDDHIFIVWSVFQALPQSRQSDLIFQHDAHSSSQQPRSTRCEHGGIEERGERKERSAGTRARIRKKGHGPPFVRFAPP